LAINGIIFDLDGTLVDTLDDLTDSMNFALKTLGFPTHSRDRCRQMIGYGLTQFAGRALGAGNIAHRDKLLEVMTGHYRDHCFQKTKPYSGIVEVVLRLQKQGIRLAVLTNKNQEPAEKITEFYFGRGVFDPITGHQAGRKTKPDPEGVFAMMDRWRLPASEIILIGDSEVDIQTALAAGVLPVGVAWGFRSPDELRLAGAEKIIEASGQILELLI